NAIVSGDNTVYARYYKAIAQKRMGQLDQALSTLEPAARISPEDGELQLEYGSLLRNTGRTNEAITVLKKARTLKPKDRRTHVGLALSYFRQKNYADAVEVLMLANRVLPEEPVIQQLLSVARSRLNSIPSIKEKEEVAAMEP